MQHVDDFDARAIIGPNYAIDQEEIPFHNGFAGSGYPPRSSSQRELPCPACARTYRSIELDGCNLVTRENIGNDVI